LAVTFAVWYAKEKTLSIHSIFTTRREIFYWVAILFTFALGTASGDLMAESLGLGYFTTGVIVCIVIAIFALAWKLGLNSILAFWLIYIMTRPLGASLGDYLSQSREHGGLGLGATTTSAIFILAIIVTVVFLVMTKRDVITNPEVNEEADEKGRHGIVQVAAVAVLLVIASVGGYYWRQNALKARPQNAVTSPTGSTGSPTTANAPASPLGDLSSFKKITQDCLDLVNKGDLAGAKKRVADLEYEWDNSQARLKPMNPTRWTEIDAAIDKVLRELRAVNPNAQSSKSALEALLVVLNKQ
jgi:hypothetical protein